MKLLIAVASKHGSTEEIAEKIQATIARSGIQSDVVPCDQATVDGYDALVIGSAVYAGHWRPEALAFVDRIESELASTPVWLFSSGPLGDPPKPPDEPVEVAEIIDRLSPRGHALFAGKLDKGRLSVGERTVVRMVKAPYGDFRPWDDIAGWAEEIAAYLGNRLIHIPVLGPDDGRLPSKSDHELRPD